MRFQQVTHPLDADLRKLDHADSPAPILLYPWRARSRRQSQIFARHGAEIPHKTLARWMVQVGERLMPLVDTLRQRLPQGPLIHMDETNGLSPYEYLQFVFETLPTLGEDDDLSTLLPWHWKDTLPV